MQDYYFRRLNEVMNAFGIKVWPEEKIFQCKQIKSVAYKSQLSGLYHELGGRDSWDNITDFTFAFLSFDESKHIIMVEDESLLNRYRKSCLQIPFYEEKSVQNLVLLCRNLERECLKTNSKSGAWSSKIADRHFGEAALPSDFSGNGASMWKLRAIEATLLDMYWREAGYKILRFNIHDKLMLSGKIDTFKNYLLPKDENLHFGVCNSILRKLELPLLKKKE